MKYVFLIAALLLSFLPAFSYPISPRPLRKLVMESEYIVTGKVIRLGEEEIIGKNKFERSRYYAVILVKEVLQGSIKEDSVYVNYHPYMVCPAPPRYEKDFFVMAFLYKDKRSSKVYNTHALSYGSKLFPLEEGVEVYKKRVKEMQEIVKLGDSEEKYNRTVDWLLKCASDKHTRWEGVYELSPESDFMSYYDHEGGKRFYLNKEQTNSLFNSLVKIEKWDYYDLGLADLVKNDHKKAVLDMLKNQLIKSDTSYGWEQSAFMERIVAITEDGKLKETHKLFTEVLFDEKKEVERKKLYQQFVEEMKKSEPREAVYATGSNVG